MQYLVVQFEDMSTEVWQLYQENNNTYLKIDDNSRYVGNNEKEIAENTTMIANNHGAKIKHKIPNPMNAFLIINSAHITKDKPNQVFYNVKIPVTLTGNTKRINNELHHETLINNEKHWISYYSLIFNNN